MKQRIEWIDAAKAIGIALVVLGHCYWINHVPFVRNAVYSFHMPLFFIISGFFIKPLCPKDSVKKYAKAYLKPYVISSILMLLLILLCGYFVPTDTNLVKDWLSRFLFASSAGQGGLFEDWPLIGPTWYLWGIFWACCFVSIILYRWNNTSPYIIMILGIFAYSIHLCNLPLSIQGGCNGAFFVYTGYLVRKYDILSRFSKNPLFVQISLLVLIMFTIYKGEFNVGTVKMGVGFLSTAAAIISCLFLFTMLKHVKAKGGWIGSHTLQILCAHSIIQYYEMIYGHLCEGLLFNSLICLLCEYVLEFSLAIILAWMINRIIVI